jgi:serine/threonine-protein kinase RsbW
MHQYGNKNREWVAMVDLSASEAVRRVMLHSLAELRPLSERVENWMRVLGYANKDLFAVTLSLHEAVDNAFRHGNWGDPGRVVRVHYVVTLSEVLIEVEDEGPGFDPSQVPDLFAGENTGRNTGRGLFLMRAYMNGVTFNPQGNRVTLWRRRSDA